MGMRNRASIQNLARKLEQRGLRPNAVSLASVVFTALAAICLLFTQKVEVWLQIPLFLLAPVLIALRGMCNLLDGMIAIEGGHKSNSGEVFNDLPDRLSDILMLASTGYAVVGFSWGAALGWAAASLAVLTAYVRVLGGCVGAKQYFVGPMAKTHRMLLFSIACAATAIEKPLWGSTWALTAALAIIALGCFITASRRAILVVRELESR